MSIFIKFKSSIPLGMKIIEHGIEVSDVKHRYYTVKKFARRRKRRIYLERVLNNKEDLNAIRVIGKSKGWFFESNKCIGYVPTDIAKQLIATGLENKVKVQPQLIWVDDKHHLGVRFDIVGLENDYEKYCS